MVFGFWCLVFGFWFGAHLLPSDWVRGEIPRVGGGGSIPRKGCGAHSSPKPQCPKSLPPSKMTMSRFRWSRRTSSSPAKSRLVPQFSSLTRTEGGRGLCPVEWQIERARHRVETRPRTHALQHGNPGHFGAVRGVSKMVLFPGAVSIERVLGTPERRPLPGDVRCLAHKIPCIWEGAYCSSLPRITDDAHS